jgi:hypothetical protein
MRKYRVGALAFACLVGLGISAPAKANVIYDLTFDNYGSTVEGSGVLTLNFSTVSQAYGLSYQSLAPLLVSITTTNIDGNGAFTIMPSNLASGSAIQTAATSDPPAGHIYTLTAQEAGSGSSAVLFLDLYTGTWQIHSSNDNGATVDQGDLLVTGPTLATSTPLPGALSVFSGGLGLVGFLLRRKKRKAALVAA